jgi:hypothetical protein
MGAEGFGSSIVIAFAALLWLVYLVPTWFRRKEYLSTERNAVRLQQTLRIMAETAEVPQQVRVETSARSAAAQEKLLRAQLQREKASWPRDFPRSRQRSLVDPRRRAGSVGPAHSPLSCCSARSLLPASVSRN